MRVYVNIDTPYERKYDVSGIVVGWIGENEEIFIDFAGINVEVPNGVRVEVVDNVLEIGEMMNK